MDENGTAPLSGRTILVTRVAEQAEPLCRALELCGATAIVLPMVEFAAPDDYAPLDAALKGIAEFRWLFLTSQNAVRALAERSAELNISLPGAAREVRIAAVGPATADAATKAGLRVTYTALKHRGTSLAAELASEVPGWRVLLPRSDRANPVLPEMLRKMGAEVVEVIAYRTINAAETSESQRALSGSLIGDVDAVVFFSPSAVEAFIQREHGGDILSAAATHQDKFAIVAIGEVTATALRKSGVHRPIVAADTSVDAVMNALKDFFAAQSEFGSEGIAKP
ncbi:MAG TPA: uroporphyrinogen-III synthase [Terriglobales bacterium]|nr:uroporphyrinogen-III synthase [Terriglobales bacterium]